MASTILVVDQEFCIKKRKNLCLIIIKLFFKYGRTITFLGDIIHNNIRD